MWIAWEWGPRKVINGNGHHNHPPTTICRSALWESDPIHVQVTPTNGLFLRSPLIHWPASGTSRNPINPVDEKINYPCPFVHGLVHLVGGWLYGHREEIALAKYCWREERRRKTKIQLTCAAVAGTDTQSTCTGFRLLCFPYQSSNYCEL